MSGGAHAVLKAISLLRSTSAGLRSLLTSGGCLTSKQETPNAAAAAPSNRPPLITCGGQNVLRSAGASLRPLQASVAGPFLIFDQVKVTMTSEGRVWILNPPANECLRLPKVGEKKGKRGERPGSGQGQPQSPCGRKSLMMLFALRTKLKTRRH